jgi:hypothetical protein
VGISWLRLDVHSAVVSAVALTIAAIVLRAFPRRWTRVASAAAVETALVCALFGMWQVANGIAHTHHAGGMAHGAWVWDLERTLHLPSEVSLQHLVLGSHWLVWTSNYYYATAHLTSIVVFLCWLWVRHRDRYRLWRNTLVGFTGMSLLVQMIPVAPPRLIGIPGLVDTAMAYGQSVYAVLPPGVADQDAAMPSIHVGWALLIGAAVWSCAHGHWRWIGVAHATFTTLIVVWTGNHYWMDGIVAAVLLVIGYVAARVIERVLPGAAPVGAVEPIALSPDPATGRMAV